MPQKSDISGWLVSAMISQAPSLGSQASTREPIAEGDEEEDEEEEGQEKKKKADDEERRSIIDHR